MDAFRSGLSDIMPPAALGVFSEAELDSMLCGQGQAWTPEVLTECVTFDHGYTAQSPPIKALMEVLCGYGPQEQRAFLRFVTGAPRLPPRRFGRSAATADGGMQATLGRCGRRGRGWATHLGGDHAGGQGFAIGHDVRELSEAAAVQLRGGTPRATRVRHHGGRGKFRSVVTRRTRRETTSGIEVFSIL